MIATVLWWLAVGLAGGILFLVAVIFVLCIMVAFENQ